MPVAQTAKDILDLLTSAMTPGQVRVYQQEVSFDQFTDGGGAAGTLDLDETIPAGARFLYSLVSDLVGFSGNSSAALTIGDGTDVDRYSTGTPSVFASAAAGVDLGVPSGTAWHSTAKTPKLTITGGSDWGLVTAGSLLVTLAWLTP